GDFTIPFSASIYSRLIGPFCDALEQLQLHYLDTTELAYIPPGAGAIYVGGKVRKSELGRRFLESRQALLQANKRMLVDLRRVSDPEYREALVGAGVKPSPVNSKIHGPGIDGQILMPDSTPARPPKPPRASRVSPLAGPNRLARAAPPRAGVNQAADVARRRGVALGVAAGGAALSIAVAVAADKSRKR
ncbi:MAG: hypothetical protein KC457_29485, partial [Myxococcales bacterium]|nr:hypothetical protein [Myxococcales bacterium]